MATENEKLKNARYAYKNRAAGKDTNDEAMFAPIIAASTTKEELQWAMRNAPTAKSQNEAATKLSTVG